MGKTPPYSPQQHGYPSQVAPPQQGYPPQAPPPRQGYPPQGVPPPYSQPSQQSQNSGSTTVVVNAPQVVLGAPVFHEVSVRCTCPHCRAYIMTSTNYTTGNMAWLFFLILFFLGIWPCCLIPFFANGFKDVVHTCPNCGCVVGRFNRM
ncbi:cell death-inducing p53-target protein 1 homolog [Ylistrum balloti]|uniref:cell death-inducing p53-target protein 1 homolog n=1 Tax=Ylistrum balloti TaxID=509963 RepID=UPI002905F1AA|nr:cell death-inducing p53-target protein 1 homolog [Ylistrum balloti]